MRVPCTLSRLLISLSILALPGASTSSAEKAETAVVDVGSHKQLFIDNRFIESSRGVTLTMNSPRQDGKVLITADQPWEKDSRVCVYSSVIKEDGKVRVWYDLLRPTGSGPYDHERRVCYAESEDGLHFTKPELGLHEVDGSTANNVVLPGVIGGCAVWIDPNAAPKDRYKTQTKVYPSGRLQMHGSPDGLRWRLFAELNPGPGGWDTQSVVFWDARISRYVLYTRYWFRKEPREASYRTVRRLESDDLRQWENQSIAIQADQIDLSTYHTTSEQPAVDYYGADVFCYDEAEDVYIMLAQAYWHWQKHPRKGSGPATFDVRLAVSRDGKSFQRAGNRKAFLPTGPDGRFDSRMVWAMPDPIRMGDELWIYYAGANSDHAGNVDAASNGEELTGISRAVLRLDGFVSADAEYTGGELTTPLIRFAGKRLELNVNTGAGGSVLVELLDEKDQPIEGYSKSDAVSVNGNSVRGPVRWNTGDDVSRLAGQSLRIRFHMRDCKLYAFQFRD
jgi:hypothetical protein